MTNFTDFFLWSQVNNSGISHTRCDFVKTCRNINIVSNGGNITSHEGNTLPREGVIASFGPLEVVNSTISDNHASEFVEPPLPGIGG